MTEDEALKLLEEAARSCNNIDEQRALDALMQHALASAEACGVDVTCEQTNHDECENPIPLYTAPPQREWVGLTAEDLSSIKFLVEMRFPAVFRAGARWAEVKLKDKNT